MSRIPRRLAWLLLTAALLVPAAVAAGRPGPAQKPAAPARDADMDQEAFELRQRLREDMLQSLRQVYLQSFDRLATGVGQNEEGARLEIEAPLVKRLEQFERACGLTDPQKKKLWAAGQGDIKRFADHFAEAKRRIIAIQDVQDLEREIQKESAPLAQERAALAVLHGPIFTGTVARTLTDEQRARYEQDNRDRRAFRHRAAVRWTVVLLARSLGLTDDQRRRLEAVLLEETRPPGKVGAYDYAIVMYQASLIPEAKVRPIFDEVQWRVVSREFASFKDQERWLRAGGFLPLEMIGD